LDPLKAAKLHEFPNGVQILVDKHPHGLDKRGEGMDYPACLIGDDLSRARSKDKTEGIDPEPDGPGGILIIGYAAELDLGHIYLFRSFKKF
jgi:hypothetical protein